MNQDLHAMNEKLSHLKKTRKWVLILLFILFVIFAIVIAILVESNILLELIIYFVVGVGSIVFGYKTVLDSLFKASAIREDFKKNGLPKLIEEVMPGVHYDDEAGLTQEQVSEMKIFYGIDRFHSEDFFSGDIAGVSFISSDVQLERKLEIMTESGVVEDYTKFFFGRMFCFQNNKNMNDLTIILSVDRPLPPELYTLEKVDMESVEFNQHFHVYSSNPHEAFFQLTPDILESILHLDQSIGGALYFSFYQNSLNIAINNRINTFEIPLSGQISEEHIHDFIQDLKLIQDLIGTMKLNHKLFNI